MRQEDSYTERDLREMEDRIRSLGVPYSSDEPDERYWANFRVRLLDRIEAREVAPRSVFSAIADWFGVSSFRSIAIGSAVAIVAAASVMMMRTASVPNVAPVATTTTTPQASVAAPHAPEADAPAAVAEQTTSVAPTTDDNTDQAVTADATNSTASDIDTNDASIEGPEYDPMLSPDRVEEPVDYSSLSEEELQSVLDGINTITK